MCTGVLCLMFAPLKTSSQCLGSMDGQVKQILCINQSQEPRVICLSKYSTADLENLSQVCVCVCVYTVVWLKVKLASLQVRSKIDLKGTSVAFTRCKNNTCTFL